jgi:L-seryl-tRNA(Ser) seleniumtransferase
VRRTVREAQQLIRSGLLDPDEDIVAEVLRRLPHHATTARPIINATGVVLHTNLGRASLSSAARTAVAVAAGYVDVEFELAEGKRAPRGRGTLAALLELLPDAGDAFVVNNGAAALLLAIEVVAHGREVVWSRGEMIEIGDGFRLHELVACSGVRVHEVGTTNRTTRADYAAAVNADTGCILKVHTSNFRMAGFTSSASITELVGLGVPLIVDLGSGLPAPDPMLPHEPDIASALRAGADLVTVSGDKLLGGPQSGIIAGNAGLVARLKRHPMARALRVDKLTLAALEATLRGPATPTFAALHANIGELRRRADVIAERIGAPATVAPSDGAVGGGSAPGLALPGWAVSLPERFASLLRTGEPAVVGRVEAGRCLLDVRCVDPADDDVLVAAVLACR